VHSLRVRPLSLGRHQGIWQAAKIHEGLPEVVKAASRLAASQASRDPMRTQLGGVWKWAGKAAHSASPLSEPSRSAGRRNSSAAKRVLPRVCHAWFASKKALTLIVHRQSDQAASEAWNWGDDEWSHGDMTVRHCLRGETSLADAGARPNRRGRN